MTQTCDWRPFIPRLETPPANPVSMSIARQRIESTWLELLAEGFEVSRVDAGIWDGARNYEIRFLAREHVVESFKLALASLEEFEEVRCCARLLGCSSSASPAGFRASRAGKSLF